MIVNPFVKETAKSDKKSSLFAIAIFLRPLFGEGQQVVIQFLRWHRHKSLNVFIGGDVNLSNIGMDINALFG
jgi:hypothetical protein